MAARRITDSDVRQLACIAGGLKADYVREGEADPWEGSTFRWIRTLPSRQRGKIGTDTFWLSFPASQPPAWLEGCGGPLATLYQALETVRKK